MYLPSNCILKLRNSINLLNKIWRTEPLTPLILTARFRTVSEFEPAPEVHLDPKLKICGLEKKKITLESLVS